jgi:autoinducer 2-degrading protein
MLTASAVFSEQWIRNGDVDAEIGVLTATAEAGATDPGRIGWLIHRDLKAPGHVLSYELFGDPAASATPGANPRLFDSSIPCSVAPAQAPRRKTLAPDGPVAIFVYCRIEDMEAFAPSMTLHIETTLASEPGCLAFAWHHDDANDRSIILYELYASRNALAEHRRSTHLAAFRERSEHLMLDARIHYAALLPGPSLARITKFFGGQS